MNNQPQDWFKEAMQALAEQRKQELLDLLYRLDKLERKGRQLPLSRLPPLNTGAERQEATNNIRERIAVLEAKAGL